MILLQWHYILYFQISFVMSWRILIMPTGKMRQMQIALFPDASIPTNVYQSNKEQSITVQAEIAGPAPTVTSIDQVAVQQHLRKYMMQVEGKQLHQKENCNA